MKTLLTLCISTLLFSAEVTVEILGSGGPELDGRASSAYLISVEDDAKVLIDTGSGSMLRFEQSGARLESLEAILLTHLHIDHAVDLPAFIKAGYFSDRTSLLPIIGPSGNSSFPSIDEYLKLLFGPDGAYRYMQDVLTPQSDSFQIVAKQMGRSTTMMHMPSFDLEAIPVHHGIVPALAFRVTISGKKIVISGDTNDKEHGLEKLAKDADLFIAHHAIPEQAGSYAKELHMTPAIIGRIADKAKVKRVVLSHRMNRTIDKEKESLLEIRRSYDGDVLFAEDRLSITF